MSLPFARNFIVCSARVHPVECDDASDRSRDSPSSDSEEVIFRQVDRETERPVDRGDCPNQPAVKLAVQASATWGAALSTIGIDQINFLWHTTAVGLGHLLLSASLIVSYAGFIYSIWEYRDHQITSENSTPGRKVLWRCALLQLFASILQVLRWRYSEQSMGGQRMSPSGSGWALSREKRISSQYHEAVS